MKFFKKGKYYINVSDYTNQKGEAIHVLCKQNTNKYGTVLIAESTHCKLLRTLDPYGTGEGWKELSKKRWLSLFTPMPLCIQCSKEHAMKDSSICEKCNLQNETDQANITRFIELGHSQHCALRIVWGDGECVCAKRGVTAK